jgi:CRISPR-associated endonuclease/helicase Cas3
MPEHARILIEGVYGDTSEIPPTALDASDIKDQGESSAKTSQAMQNSLRLDEGYCHGVTTWWEEALTPTRLGEPETTLCLARWQDGQLVPWCSGDRGWDLSQVKLRGCYQYAAPQDPLLKMMMENIINKLPTKGRWSVLVPLVNIEPGLWQGEVQDEQGKIIPLFYDERLGLQRENDR